MTEKNSVVKRPELTPKLTLIYLLTGVSVGIFSGLFGVGGGLIVVPVLVYILRVNHRQAAGTSLLAIIFPVCAAASTYFWHGYYHPQLVLLLAISSLVGVQTGTWLLRILDLQIVRIIFIVVILFLATSLLFVYPQRGLTVSLTLGSGLLVLVIGLLAGLMAGLLGIGGGGIVIPMLILTFGMSDLIAKGSALLMMVITCISGTVSNLRHGQIDYKAAIIIGISATFVAPLGAQIATLLTPVTANILFAVFLASVVTRTVIDVIENHRKAKTVSG